MRNGNVFNSLQLPIAKEVVPKTIGQDLIAVDPMTFADASDGRKIEEYPYEKKYISRDLIQKHLHLLHVQLKDFELDWLDVASGYIMPLNTEKNVYYLSYDVVEITWYKPTKSIFDDIIHNGSVGYFDPLEVSFQDLRNEIEIFKKSLI